MDLVSAIEKLLTERGSAAVLRDHLALIRDQAKILENENDVLKKRVAELEELSTDLAGQLAAAKKEKDRASVPKHRIASGELIVDGILWSYAANEDTGKWKQLHPLCPHCRTQLCVDDVSSIYAIQAEDRRVRYHCDYDTCGKFNSTFEGTANDREEKAMRHINRSHGQAKNA